MQESHKSRTDMVEDAELGTTKESPSLGEIEVDFEQEKALVRKQDLRILPLCAGIYLLCYLDRSNIGNAKTLNAGTGNDLLDETNMTDHQYIIALMVFLIAYGVFEVPSNYLLKKLKPSRWIAFLMFSWGAVTMGLGGAHSFAQVAGVRFLLGALEAGLFPGLVFYLTFWYKVSERSLRVAFILASATLAGAFGGAISYGVGHMNGVRGLSAWRWLFIIEGAPSCASAILVWFFLPDYPETCSFLNPEDKALSKQRLAVEGGQGAAKAMTWNDAKAVLTEWRLYAHYLVYFSISVPFSSLSLFTPTITAGLGYEALQAQLMTVPPYAVARGVHSAIFSFIGAIGFIASAALPADAYLSRYGCLIIATSGAFSCIPPLLGWLSSNLRSTAGIGLAIAMNISFGAPGQIVGVWIYKSDQAKKGFPTGHWTNAALLLLASVIEKMDIGTAAAALIGGATVTGYLNAKFHIQKDISTLATLKYADRQYANAIGQGQGNPWFVLLQTVKKYPNMTCLWTREKSYTYREIQDQACQYAHFYLSQGVKKGDLVALYLLNSTEFIVAWVALWSIGCAPAAINYNLTGDALLHCLKISGATILLVDKDADCRARVEESHDAITGDLGMKPMTLDSSLKAHISTFQTTLPPKELSKHIAGEYPAILLYTSGTTAGEYPAILLYTSGTTGMPKGCAFTMSRLYTHLFARRDLIGETPGPAGDRWYSCMPLYHGTAGISIIASLVTGISIAIAPKFSVSRFWTDVRDSESTIFVYVGETARYLLAPPPSPQDRNHKVRCMYGNGLRPDIWERFRERFGVAEVGEFFNSSEGVFGLFNYNRGPFTSGSVGHDGLIMRGILRNVFVPVAIDPETGDILRDSKTGFAVRAPYEQGGEILVNIPGEEAFQGYWNNDEATNKKYLRDVFKKGDLYYRSGDALRRQSDGRWYFLDRLGDTFRWKSENVATAEVSEVLGQFPGITEANVYGVRLPNHEGRAGCAAIQISPDARQTFDYTALAKFVRSKLPKYAVPLFLRIVENPTHIHNNKQNKVPLRDEGVDTTLVGTRAPEGKDDYFLWIAPGDESYSAYGEKEWERLSTGNVRL
ncbi:Major facilitator superfamily domain, general substrate transporter [Penicillium italicum]|uniref:Very long-chain fatty acid transport protein n=1 Tax=Penicillium italicum TaxID=40296 RepID=A0A0A2L107_PENIT|nr:Major facilitator superfamily domain, general substrate transporter [Penicillium italicum]